MTLPESVYELQCPICKQVDQVRKASAIIDSETFADGHANAGSLLAIRLYAQSPGPEPQPETATLGCVTQIVAGLFAVVVGFYGLGVTLSGGGGGQSFAGIIVIIVGVAPLLLARSWSQRRAASTAAAEHLNWEAASAIWDRTFYCGRCDQSFVVDLGQT